MQRIIFCLFIGILTLATCAAGFCAVVINEILYDVPLGVAGDANNDGTRDAYEDEFVEIYNTGATAVNIGGWTIDDDEATGGEFTFPSGTSIGPGEFITLFGGGTPTGFSGQVFTDDGTIGNGLSNSGDLVILKNASGTTVDSYNDNGATEDESAYRWPDGTGSWYTTKGEQGIADFTPQASNRDRSLLIQLSTFEAIVQNGKVLLRWQTEAEIDHVGWEIYRSEKKDGKFVKINDELIKGSGNSGMPRTYQYVDKTAIAGRQYYYYLEDIDIFGNVGKSDIIGISKGKAPSAKGTLSTTWGAIKQKRRW